MPFRAGCFERRISKHVFRRTRAGARRRVEGGSGTAPAHRSPSHAGAIAHPTRLALLEALTHHGPLTATEASEIIGESPTNCAFHLRTLAKYDFVEEAGHGVGQRRPWRRKHLGFSVTTTHDDPDAATAVAALGEVLITTMLDRISAARARQPYAPPEWRELHEESQFLSYVTAAEARQLNADLYALLARYRDRLTDPANRPAGSRPFETLVFSYPLDVAGPRTTAPRTGPERES